MGKIMLPIGRSEIWHTDRIYGFWKEIRERKDADLKNKKRIYSEESGMITRERRINHRRISLTYHKLRIAWRSGQLPSILPSVD